MTLVLSFGSPTHTYSSKVQYGSLINFKWTYVLKGLQNMLKYKDQKNSSPLGNQTRPAIVTVGLATRCPCNK